MGKLPNPIEDILKKVKEKEAEINTLIEEAKRKAEEIISSAYTEKSNIFKEMQEIYRGKLESFKREIAEKQTQEIKNILDEKNKHLQKLQEKEDEIVKKIVEYLLSQVKSHGYR